MSGGPARVLVVDDDPYIRKLLADLMAIEGHQPITAEDGEQALQVVAREKPDVVLLDVRMPGLDGLEVCRRLKADEATARIPVFMVTALDEKKDRLAGIEAGADDFLSKPVDSKEVALRVRNGLRAKRLADRLDESLQSLRRLERVRQDLMHMVVHDLRNPLSGISGSLNMLHGSEQIPQGSVERGVVDESRSLARRMDDMLASILDLARMEEGEMPLRRVPGDLGEVAREAASSFFGEWLGRTVEVDAPEPAPAEFDREVVRRVLVNLVENAVRYTPEGTRVVVRVRGRRLEVRDDGPGIPWDQQTTIFEKYRRMSERASSRGVGLGLAFCRQAVEAHGGRIGVQSELGRGTTFWLELEARP